MAKYSLEIAAFTLEGAMTAQAAGADRIEFCENPSDGGTTPSYGNLKQARSRLKIPVFPIIRPRAGDFLYSEAEFDAMIQDLQLCKNLGFDGVVLGLLNADGSIDKRRTTQLVEMAYPMDVTFHRAFDRCKDPLQSLEDVIDCGCTRILTSGQFPAALDGAELISQLVNKADDRITILVGSGVNSSNIKSLAEKTGATEFHASARIAVPSVMEFEVESMREKNEYMGVNPEEVKSMRAILDRL